MLNYFNIKQDIAPQNLNMIIFINIIKKIELFIDKFSIKKNFLKKKI